MALKFRDRDNVRDAYRAGVSGARSYPGPEGKGYDSSFQRGRRSAKQFRNRKFRPTKRNVGNFGDKVVNAARNVGNVAREAGGDFKDMLFPTLQMGKKGLDALLSNIQRSKQNREILGDAYTDDLRTSMMTDDDLKFYNKYVGLADMASTNRERDRLMGVANTAMQNAQITNRINYALGQPEFGFETTAPAGIANIDYSTLADRMVGGTDDSVGLQGTAVGKEFLKRASKAVNEEKGGNLISDEIMNYRDPIRDMVAPKTPPVSQSALMNVSEQNLMPTYEYDTYGDPMDNILYGEPGSGIGSLLLQSMYPGYSDFADTDRAQKYELENMNERELMQFGYANPPIASMFGFNPENYPDYGNY